MNLAQRTVTPQLGGPPMNQFQNNMGGGPPSPGMPQMPEDPDVMAQLAQISPELLRAIMAKMQQQPGAMPPGAIANNFNPVQFAAGVGDKMNPGMGLLGYLGGGSGGDGV